MLPGEKLQSASDDVQYELWMLFEVTSELVANAAVHNERNPFMYNALIESFCIHARNLLHFLYGKRQRDDVMAEDFIPNWSDVRPVIPSSLQTIRNQVSKHAAHLTYSRSKTKPVWDWRIISNEIVRIFNSSFLPRIDADSLGERWPIDGQQIVYI